MKVILLGELRGKGGEGDIVDVATGFAVNYLFPKKLAVEASKGNLKQLELRKHNIAKREAERLDSADKLVSALEGKVVTIPAKVGEEGQLFGSVTALQIASAVAEQIGQEIDRKQIDLRAPIKTAGEHTAVVSIYREISAAITVMVVDEKAPEVVEAVETDEPDEAAEVGEAVDGGTEEAEVAADSAEADVSENAGKAEEVGEVAETTETDADASPDGFTTAATDPGAEQAGATEPLELESLATVAEVVDEASASEAPDINPAEDARQL